MEMAMANINDHCPKAFVSAVVKETDLTEPSQGHLGIEWSSRCSATDHSLNGPLSLTTDYTSYIHHDVTSKLTRAGR